MTLILSGTDGLSDIDGSAATPAIRGTDANTGMFFPAADTIAFAEGGTESMRLDSSGNVGIGTSSPLATAMLEVSRSTTVIPTATVTADNAVTGWRVRRTGGTYPREYYMGIRENSTALDFYDNTANALRARIDSNGVFLVGTSSTFDVTSGATTQLSGQCAVYNNGSPNTLMSFYNSSQSARVGFIGSSGNSTQYNSGSDYRLKDNVTNMSGALSKISALRPVTFTWKVSPEVGVVSGFIAHELDEVVPESVSGEKDAMCSDGVTPDYQMVDLSKLVPLLTAAIQEQQTMIQELTAKVAALEAKG
jgi:hypothetical protein